jgi:hypothetical protein
MEPGPIQRRYGDRAIGLIEEGNGCGSRAIGQDLQDLMPIGRPAIGNPEEEAGFGGKAAGSIGNGHEFKAYSSE